MSVRITPRIVATPSAAAAYSARGGCPAARNRLEIARPSGNLCKRIARNTRNPSDALTPNPLAIATPSTKVCNSNPASADMLTTLVTSCVSSPKWKCGASVCCVRCTRSSRVSYAPPRSPARDRLRKMSVTDAAIMKPAASAIIVSSARGSIRAAR